MDLFGNGFTFLRFGGSSADVSGVVGAARAAGVPLTVCDIDEAPVAALYERKLVLVRSDGHVAWRSDSPPETPRSLIDRVRGTLG